MPQRLDAKDQRILSALSENARQSLSSIGRKVGLSEEVVNYRLRGLIKNQIIVQFRTEIDVARLGYKWYRLYLRLEGADSEKEQEIFNYLVNSSGAYWTAICEGKYNLIFRFVAKDEIGLNEVLNDLSIRFSPYIKWRDLTLPIEAHYYASESGAYGRGGPKYEPPSRKAPVEVDEKDLKLLGGLAEESRAATTKLAGELGLTPNAVKYRMKRLENEGVIKGYQVVSDRSKLGMYHYKILLHFQKTDEVKVKKFVRHCESLPNLLFLTRSIGAWDMDVDFDFGNTIDAHNSILNLTGKFRDLIKGYEVLPLFKARYCNPMRGLAEIEKKKLKGAMR